MHCWRAATALRTQCRLQSNCKVTLQGQCIVEPGCTALDQTALVQVSGADNKTTYVLRYKHLNYDSLQCCHVLHACQKQDAAYRGI